VSVRTHLNASEKIKIYTSALRTTWSKQKQSKCIYASAALMVRNAD